MADSSRSRLSDQSDRRQLFPFAALQKRLRKTVVFVTHDVREALLLSDHIALMEGGRLIALCAPKEFLQSRDPLVAAYVKSADLDNCAPGGKS